MDGSDEIRTTPRKFRRELLFFRALLLNFPIVILNYLCRSKSAERTGRAKSEEKVSRIPGWNQDAFVIDPGTRNNLPGASIHPVEIAFIVPNYDVIVERGWACQTPCR